MSGLISSAGSRSGVIGTTELEYEEGSWTPVISRTSSAPSGTPTVIGKYIKTGNVVFVQGYAILNGYSGGSGQWTCTLPFTASNHTDNQAMGKCRIYMSGDSNDRQFRIVKNTNIMGLHTPSNDQSYNSTISYLIWAFSGSYSIA